MREAGRVAWSTPSRMTGPLPALMSCVKIVSITSSLGARPPQVVVRVATEGGELDLEERALLGVGLADVDDEEVGEHQLGQRMAAVLARRPVGLPVEPVPEREVRVQPRAVRAEIAVREVERVLHVVEVADLEVPVHRIELLRRQHEVLDLGSPDALDPDVELAARERFSDDADERRTAQERGVDLDHEAEDVLAVHVDRPVIGELHLAGRDRLERRGRVHDERIPARAGEDANAVAGAALRVVHAERDGLARRGGAGALLLGALRAVVADRGREHAVEDELLLAGGERRRVAGRACREGAQPEAIEQSVGEQVIGLRERKRVHHEHEMSGPLRARKRVDVGDVGDRVGERSRP